MHYIFILDVGNKKLARFFLIFSDGIYHLVLTSVLNTLYRHLNFEIFVKGHPAVDFMLVLRICERCF